MVQLYDFLFEVVEIFDIVVCGVFGVEDLVFDDFQLCFEFLYQWEVLIDDGVYQCIEYEVRIVFEQVWYVFVVCMYVEEI